MARITIEDSLKEGQNRFGLTLLTIRRVKQLLKGSKPLSKKRNNREVVTALREVAEGKVKYAHPEHFFPDNSEIKEIQRDMEFTGDEKADE
ncbi:MAG: DNA-directed RNA polymerase subunit omega [Syntrophaceae bacterium]|nr:DNA-directed RNA polymerase subunit omega [Syntrophaceae bacterium]